MGNGRYRIEDIIALLRHADMSASYKPTLLEAIVRCLRRNELSTERISLQSLAQQYLNIYWPQVVVFRLRHSARDAAPPTIIRKIESAASQSATRWLAEVPQAVRSATIEAIAKVLPLNVLAAFHRSRPERMPLLFEWHRGLREIRVGPKAQAFVKDNSVTLSLIANYFLARFLSRLNAVPHIIEKVTRGIPRRSSLNNFAAQLRSLGETRCFYCNIDLENEPKSPIDHFIPWTFVYEDRLWNMVLCCRKCNGMKSDGLPDEALLARLVALNQRRSTFTNKKTASQLALQHAGSELEKLYRLARDEQWPAWRMQGPCPG